MKEFIKRIFLFTIFIYSIFAVNVKATELPPVYSEGAVLMDGRTGKIIYSKNEHTQYEPASTTKVMTALIVLENAKLSDKVTIGEKPTLVDGSAIGIAKGEVYTVEELMLGLLLESGNDCAEALAEYISGSNEEFAKLMNAKAKELGALDTNFKNPSGLHEDGHVTTAYDLALIMRAAYQNEDLVRIAQTESYKYVNHPFSDGSEKWATNRNQLFNEYTPYYYQYAYIGKNGYTPEANHTYTATAMKDGQFLVATFLNATDKDNFYTNIGPLFNYGFDNFETIKLINKNDVLDTYKINDEISIPLLAKDDLYYTKNKSEEIPSYTVNYSKKDIRKQNINKGDALFKAKINVNGETISSLDLVSGANREYNNQIKIKEKFSALVSTPKFIVIAVVVTIIFVILIRYLILSIRRRNLRRRRPRFK
ncbi:D-alanyl-D-alanine carboxypeptidase family protein [Clostridium sp.]|uniref:D-alanyl-D-alanine carboxypeptidase family protein n=1 Tax=Clostridium sp. TaxID=1506 RepID=UPI0025BF9C71|nr:D-alanyl-D-alanine carboxypeptidase family protein [Clostridium sp.]